MSRAMNRRKFLKSLGAVGVAAVAVGCETAATQVTTAPTTAATSAATAAPTVRVTAGVTSASVNPTTVATSTVSISPTGAVTTTKAATTAATASATAAATPAAGGTVKNTYAWFTVPEQKFIEAWANVLIPTDALGPGAVDAGATVFIDRQLAGGYGVFARHYNMGPWQEALASQGYQSRLNPQELYRTGIREVNAYCNTTYQKTFDQLTAQQMNDVITGLQGAKIQMQNVAPATFFSTLRTDVINGFFCDPIHGGNRGFAGWKLVGYPGLPDPSYRDLVDQDKPYTGPTRGSADVQGSGMPM